MATMRTVLTVLSWTSHRRSPFISKVDSRTDRDPRIAEDRLSAQSRKAKRFGNADSFRITGTQKGSRPQSQDWKHLLMMIPSETVARL